MARKRKPNYAIQHGKLKHQTTPRQFAVWLRSGLIVLIDAKNRRLARVSAIARTIWENGSLHLAPLAQPEPNIKTNAEVVDSQYKYADAGQLRLSREDRQLIGEIRFRYEPSIADDLIAGIVSTIRERQMRLQYGW